MLLLLSPSLPYCRHRCLSCRSRLHYNSLLVMLRAPTPLASSCSTSKNHACLPPTMPPTTLLLSPPTLAPLPPAAASFPFHFRLISVMQRLINFQQKK